MSVSGILNGIGANPYTQTNGEKKAEKSGGEFSKKVMKCVSAGGQKVSLCSDALMSYASPQTGESVNIYKAEDYSEDHPLYVIKGLDANGNEFEEIIDAGKINPSQCSYNELMVLNVETGHISSSDHIHSVAVWDKAGTGSYFEKTNYMAYARAVMEEQKVMGNWTSYLSYDKWMQSLMEHVDRDQETKTDIIVKADGSRVLVVTMNVGGMETSMSLEISKPTDMQNDISRQSSDPVVLGNRIGTEFGISDI